MQSVFNRAFATAAMLTVLPAAALAHNPCCSINSPGVPGASLVLDTAGEFATAADKPLPDNGLGVPLSGHVKAFHDADGIFLQIQINDDSTNPNDAVQSGT